MENGYAEYVKCAIDWAKGKAGQKIYQLKCLAFVEDAYEMSNNIELFGGSTAKESADEYNAISNKGDPSIGSFVFYDAYGEIDGVYKNYGHVGLCIGNGNIVHTWNCIRIDKYMDIEKLEGAPGWTKPKYIGYAPIERILEGYIKK